MTWKKSTRARWLTSGGRVPEPSPLISTVRGRSSAWSTCWPQTVNHHLPLSAAQSFSLCPAETAAVKPTTDAGHHLLDCAYCGEVSGPLLERRARTTPNEVRVVVEADKDVVTARQRGREIAARAAFSTSELTMISTAISEVARNIVRFARRGQIIVSLIGEEDPVGVRIVARDVGPGIADVERALEDGFTTYGGLGLGPRRVPTSDGRVCDQLRGRPRDHGHDEQMVQAVKRRLNKGEHNDQRDFGCQRRLGADRC